MERTLRIAFAGTPVFARCALEALLEAGHDICLVLTQPDRASGRGMRVVPSPVKELAVQAGIAVCQPRSLRLDGRHPDDARMAQEQLEAAAPDVMVVAAYGLILPKWVLELPTHGCLNIHASLLPRWRGAAPIQRAIEAGDAETGITIMQMDEGLDTGDMLLTRPHPIGPNDTAATLHDALAALGARSIVEALEQLVSGQLKARRQGPQGVTYAEKLTRAEAALDVTQPAHELANRIRAFDPFPGATITLPGLAEPVKVWRAQALADEVAQAQPGEILARSAEGIDMATGHGTLRLLELQRAGGRRQPVSAFVQGWSAE